jgi:hypothetical protein
MDMLNREFHEGPPWCAWCVVVVEIETQASEVVQWAQCATLIFPTRHVGLRCALRIHSRTCPGAPDWYISSHSVVAERETMDEDAGADASAPSCCVPARTVLVQRRYAPPPLRTQPSDDVDSQSPSTDRLSAPPRALGSS